MTKPKGKTGLIDVKELLQRDEDFLRAALQALAQAALEAEMTETIGAAKGERTETRLAHRSGYCLQELRWIGACPRAGQKPDPGDRRELTEVRRDVAAWLAKWQAKHSKLCDWVEENIEETLTYYRLPLAHHKHMKSTNMLERLNQELKRRNHVVRIVPNAESCLRLVRALAVETHENWLAGTRYLNMQHLSEHKKQALRQAA